jgi:hypothetical protein
VADSPAAALLAAVRRRCLALPDVTEGLTHGGPTWFVRGRRSFVKFVDPEEHPQLDLPHIAIWAAAPPGARHELVAAAPDRFFAPRFGGRDWVGMRLDGESDWDEVGEIILDAYRQVAPKRLVARLDTAPSS